MGAWRRKCVPSTGSSFSARHMPARAAWCWLGGAWRLLGGLMLRSWAPHSRMDHPPPLAARATLPLQGRVTECLWKIRSEPAAGSNQPHDQQQHDRADRGIDDLRNETGADVNAKFGEKQTGDQRAGDADQNVADDPKARAAHDLAGQPASHQADEQNDENAFIGQYHKNFPRWYATCFARCGGSLSIIA